MLLPQENGVKFGVIKNDVSKSELLTRHFALFLLISEKFRRLIVR